MVITFWVKLNLALRARHGRLHEGGHQCLDLLLGLFLRLGDPISELMVSAPFGARGELPLRLFKAKRPSKQFGMSRVCFVSKATRG